MAVGGIDTTVAHPARRYNYWLGGKDNFAADRESGDEIEAQFPGMRAGVRANRDLLGRIVTHLAGEAGITQFLDIGTGLPTAGNTHEVAQRITPAARIVYVDNDPMVMTHAEALLTSTAEGRTAYIEADLREADRILRDPALREVLDLKQPVALMMIAVLHFIRPSDGPAKQLVDRLVAELVPGSYLAISHVTVDFMPPKGQRRYMEMVESGRSDIFPRGRAQILEFFDGLELVEPGLVLGSTWRPTPETEQPEARLVNFWAGVARKP
jgi:hypothetical protein